jgi:hypothetical protein
MLVLKVDVPQLHKQLRALMEVNTARHKRTHRYTAALDGLENFLSELNAALREQGDTICRPVMPTGDARPMKEDHYGD